MAEKFIKEKLDKILYKGKYKKEHESYGREAFHEDGD